MKNAKRTYTVDKMKGEIVKSFEEDIKVVYGDITFCEVPNDVETLIRYRNSARVAFVENVMKLYGGGHSFEFFNKYITRALKYYTKYVSANEKLKTMK